MSKSEMNDISQSVFEQQKLSVMIPNLANIVQSELTMNRDFWQSLQDNIAAKNYYLPPSFMRHISNKYQIDYEQLKSQESQILSLFVPSETPKQQVRRFSIKRKPIKYKEIPIAQFNN